MPLFSHLFISHIIPVLVITCALAISLVALVRISLVLTALNDSHLKALRHEGELHRAVWAVDVAMRHAQAGCDAGNTAERASGEVAAQLVGLYAELRSAHEAQQTIPAPMQKIIDDYVHTAKEILASDACAALVGVELGRRRAQLDESITTLWVDRLRALHQEVTDKDEVARDIAVRASWTGIPLAGISFILAILIAQRMTLVVTRPLSTLAAIATRVGKGDFKTSATNIVGPGEIESLGVELERMRAQLEELESLKQGFLASVSHELRTPLTKIREALALMEDGAVGAFTPKQSRLVQIARTACEREIRMVTTLLDLSRLRGGGSIRPRSGVALDKVLQLAVHDEHADAVSRGVDIELRAHGGLRANGLDPVLLERAIANLVRNATSVSKPGQTVVVERSPEGERPQCEGTWVCITVADGGPGVPEEIRDRIFNAFVTRAVPSSGKALGIGLGLALSREVARAHGGDLELAETGPRGTVFRMWLPIRPEADVATPAERALATAKSDTATAAT